MSNFFDRPELKRNFFDDAPEPVRPVPAQTQQPKLSRSWGETAKDLAVGVGQGTANLLGGTAELANTLTGGLIDKGVRKAQGAVDQLVNGGEFREGPGITGAYTDLNADLNSAKSPLLQRRQQELADTKGFFGSAKKVLTDPVLASQFVAEQVPQLASMAGTARGTLVKGAEKALAKGATREAAEAAGRKSLERQIVAYSAVQEAGPSAMQARQEIDQLPQSVWDSNEEYRSRIAAGEDPAAVKESMSNVAALKAAGVGGAAGALGGKLTAGLEGRIFTKSLDHAPLLSRQGVKELASTVGKEALEETIQEGGNQLGTNVGVQGIDETRGLMEGVPEAAGTGAALGGLIGGGLHVAGTATSPQLTRGPQPPPAAQPDPLALPPPDGAPGYGTIRVTPDGTAITEPQRAGIDAQNEATGLTPDVDAARAAHPGAAPNTVPLSRGPRVPYPDAAPGSLSDALNATAESAAPPAQVSDPDGLTPLAQRADAAPLGSLADAVKDVPAAPLASSSVASVPAAGAQAEDLTSARAGEDSRSQTVSREQSTLGEESAISEESASGASNDARSQQDTGIQNLAERGGPVPEPEQSVAPQLRRPGNQAASAVGAELSGVPEGSGQASGAGVYAGADRQQQRLPAGQRTVGDAQGAGEQPAKNAPADLPRKNPVADGVGGGTGPGAVNAAVPSESGRDVGGAGIVDAAPRGQEADGPSAVATAAMEAATSPDNSLKPPSPAQVEAGNFKVGRTRINGLDISIEHPAGVKRKAEHSRALAHAYGYIRRTEGADGEKFDVFLGHRAHDATLPVFVVDQNRADGSFDESKALMGFASNSEARAAYLANYPKGWGGLGAITQMTQDEFKAWVKDPAKTALPAAAPRSAEPGTAEQEAPEAAIEDEIRPAGKKRDRGFTSAASVTAAITERGLSPGDYEVKATEQGGYIGVRKTAGADATPAKPGAPAQDWRERSERADAQARKEHAEKQVRESVPANTETAAANPQVERLQQVLDSFTAGRASPEGAARDDIRSAIEALGKPQSPVDVADLLERAASRLNRKFGAQADVVYEVAEAIQSQGKTATAAKKPPKGKAEDRAAALASYFKPGNIIKSYAGYDEVLSYRPGDASQSMRVEVHEVRKVGDEWVRVGKPQDARWHSTMPDAKELKAGPIDTVPPGVARYTEPRPDGQPFPNAPRRGAQGDPIEGAAATKTEQAAEPPLSELAQEVRAELSKQWDDRFANNKVFTSDAVEKARARIKAKLGTLNSGVDPEMFVDGATIAGAYIESGVRKFGDYAKAMVADLGEAIKPYLLSFYEGVRHYPGFDAKGMDSAADAQREFEAMLTPADLQADAIGNAKPPRKTRAKATTDRGARTLRDDWGVDYIDGWTALPGVAPERSDYGLRNGVKAAFLKDATTYLKAVADLLEDQGYTVTLDRKGKPAKAVSVNESGVAGSGDVYLHMLSPDGTGIYVHIGDTSLRGVVNTTTSGIALMYRTSDGTHGKSGANQWGRVDLTAAELAAELAAHVARHPWKPEANKGGLPSRVGADERSASTQDPAHNAAEEAPNVRRNEDFQRDREGAVRSGERQRPAEDRNDDPAAGLGGRQPGEAAEARRERGADATADAQVPGRAGAGERDARAERAPDGDRVPAGGRAAPDAVVPKSNFTIAGELDFAGVGAVGKFNGNLAAIRLLKELEADGRRATPEEQSVLARYVGWGGLPQAFRHPTSGKITKGWDARVAELEQALTPEELAAAGRSTQDAHYTAERVVRAMWRAVDRLGFTQGRVLEPSMGTGNFFGLMPQQARAASALTGVELDSITGRIASQLYQGANVQVRGFNDLKIAPESFDLAIGNPPFGSQSIHDPQYPDLSKWSIHNFFFAKSIASLRPGGVLAMVVSSSFLDANTSTTRAWVAERARLLGAIRLPQTAFQQNAGTNVTTDIVFLQRLADGMEGNAQEWVAAGTASDQGQEFPLNRYFLANPDMMLGRMVWSTHTTVGRAGAVLEANPGEDLAAALDAAVAKLPAGVYVPPAKPAKKVAAEVKKAAEAAAAVKVYGYFVAEDGSLRQRQPDANGEHTDVVMQVGAAVDKRIRAMIPVRDATRDLLAAELSDASDAVIEAKRKELNRVYDAFVKANGRISRDVNKRALRDDPDFPLLLSLERDYDKGVTRDAAKKAGVEPRAESAKKADIFTKRTNYPVKPVTSVSDAKSAMLASLNERGRIDLDYMAELYAGKDRDAIVAELGDLVFRTPEGTVEPADGYLSGNVKAKLAAAREAAKDDPGMRRNVAALEKVQPQDVDAADIFVQIGTPWIPASDYADFVRETIEGKFDGRHVPALGKWLVDVQSGNRTLNKERWGTERMGADAIIEAILTDKPIVVKDKGANRDDPPVVNKAETAAALGKASELQTQFVEWLWKDASRRERLARFYNDTFNTDVRRKYDGAHMTFPGMSRGVLTGGKLRPHQSAFAYRMVQDGVAMADHVVGAGKTYAAIAGTMEMRRLGLWRKPMIVVPNHLVDQWASDFLKLYPGANVLAAGRKDFEKSNRRKLFGRIATGDWDAVIVAHSSFGFIPVPAEAEARILRAEIKEIEDALDAIRAESGKKDLSFKQLQKRKEGLETKVKKLNERVRDDLLDFAEMGVDAVVLDEAHEFKNLFFVTSKRNVAGLGSPEGSKKAFDLYVKTRMLAERDGGKNRVFLTGTPVSNTLSEVYHMQRYLQREALEERGVASFDAWASVFGQIVSDWEMDAAGRFKEKTRFRKFANLPELVSIWRQVADTVTRADLIRDAEAQGLRFPLPKIKGNKPQNIVVPRSPLQAAYIGVPTPVLDAEGKQMHDQETGEPLATYPEGSIIYRMDNMPKDPSEDNYLKATGDARKAGLDFRLVDPAAPDFPQSKANEAVRRIVELWKENNARRGTQLVFCDLSVPASARGKATEAAQAKQPTWFIRRYGVLEHVAGVKAKLSAMPDHPFFTMKEKGGYRVYDAIGAVRIGDGRTKQEALDSANAVLASNPDGMRAQFEESAIPPEEIDAYVQAWEDAKAAKDEADDNEEEDTGPAVSMDELLADQSKFSVYDDMKEKLLAAGVPPEQIAFIHDYNTDLQKADLFAKVNRGDIRVLFGSTMKMGAGMNVQKKLVALHHMDAPWRPSDLEQREGRIIRQGNEFYEADPDGFEIVINRYGTAETYDAKQWEIIQTKAEGIETFKAGDPTVREIDDISSEAANAADMKGAASGNPLILESIKLRKEIKDLEAQERSFTRARNRMESMVRSVEAGTSTGNRMLAEAQAVKDAIKLEDGLALTIDGSSYTERKAVKLEPIASLFQEALQKHDAIEAGMFHNMRIIVDGRQSGKVEVHLMVGKIHVGNTSFAESDNLSATGFVSRLENIVARVDSHLEYARNAIAQEKREAEQAREELRRGFPKEDELAAKRERSAKVVAALRSGKRAVDGDPEPAQKFSRRDPAARDGTGQRTEQVRRAIGPIVSRWGAAAPEVVVVDTAQDLPQVVRGEQGWEGVEGWYDDRAGTVYLVAGNLASDERARRVLAHEAIGHYGIEAIVGEGEWGQIRDTVYRMMKSGQHPELFAELSRRYRGVNEGLFVREAVAVMAEKGMGRGVVNRVIAAIRRFLRGIGFDLEFSERELRDLIGKSARYLRNGRRPRVAPEAGQAMAFAARPDRDWSAKVQVVGIAGGAFGDTNAVRQARAAAKNYLTRLRDSGHLMPNADTGWKIGLSRASINELVQFDQEKLNLLIALPRITNVAVLADSAPNRNPAAQGESIVAYHTLYAPVALNGEPRIARLVVQEHAGGRYAFDLQQSSVLNAQGPAGVARFPGVESGARRPGEAHAMTVGQLRDAVNAVNRPGWAFSQPNTPNTPTTNAVDSTHGQDPIDSRLAQWSAAVHLGGSGPRAVGASPEVVGAVSRNASGAAKQGDVSREEIREQSARLIQRAKDEGFFWGDDSPIFEALKELPPTKKLGGAEHQVYVVGEGENAVVIRATDNGFFGPRSDISPAQYLARLDDFNATFPSLQTRLIGVSESPDIDGNAVIWTAQAFVYGKKFGSQSALRDAMAAHGWKEDGYAGVPRYKHTASGAVIEDAHTDNVFQDDDGNLYPFDVVVEELPAGAVKFSRPDPAKVLDAMDARGVSESVFARLRGWWNRSPISSTVENTRPSWLGALTLRHLAELGKDIKLSQVDDYAKRVQQMATDRNGLQEAGAKVAEGWEKFQKADRAGADATANLMHDTTIAAVDPSRAYVPLMTGATKRGGNEAVTAESIARRIAMVDADLDADPSEQVRRGLVAERAGLEALLAEEQARVQAYPELVRRYQALPEQGRQVYQSARQVYDDHSKALRDAIIARVKDSVESGDVRDAYIAQVRQTFEDARVRGPYFPLARFGEFWINAEKDGKQAFFMYENVQEWRAGQTDLARRGYVVKEAGRKIAEARSVAGVSSAFMADLEGVLKQSGADKQVMDDVWQMYLRTLPDLSMRKHFIHRKKVEGYSGDALRAFSGNVFHGSYQIARVRHSHKLVELLDSLKKATAALAGDDPERAAKAAALTTELGQRHEWVMNPKDSKAVSWLTSLGFVWYLGMTPAAAAVNLTQTAIVTFPVLASRFGVAKAWNTLAAATGRALRNVNGDLTRGLNDEERAAFALWEKSGAIDRTMAHNLAGLSETDTRSFNPVARRTMELVSLMFHKAEVVNREATALAAFRLARDAGQDFHTAAQYAADVVTESHFDYTNANRARWMQSNTAKVLLLFRQYSLNMTWMLWRNFYLGTKGETPAVRKEARKKLAGVLGMTALFSGVMGLPLMGLMFDLANAAAAAFGDDDEPFDAEVEFRNFLADLLGVDVARILTQGPIETMTGIELGSRVGLGELWLRTPDRELEGQALAHYLLEQAAGPVVGGMLVNTLDGAKKIADGHTWRGVETMAPKSVKDAMKALRYGKEGVNTMRGDPLIEDLSLGETLMQLAGFTPADVTERYDANSAAKNYEQRILGRRRALLNAYAMAWRAEDADGIQKALGKIQAWNAKHPAMGITLDTIRRSLASRMRYSARAESGVVLDRRIAEDAREQARFSE